MKANRLLSILLLLQNQGKMTTAELAAKLEVASRTVCRDMEALSAAGVPVYAERGPYGGWALTEGYRTKLTGMNPQEIMALLLIKPTELLHDLGVGSDFDNAFQKLLAASPEHLRQYAEQLQSRLHIDGSAWYEGMESYPFLSVVQAAVWGTRKLQMTYPLPLGPYTGVVEPLGLVAKRNVWFLVARMEASVAFFRVSRIEKAELLEETFERPPGFELAVYWERATETYVSGQLAFRLVARLHEDALNTLPPGQKARMSAMRPAADGLIEAEMEFRSYDAALAAMLSLGERVEVLDPAELRAGLRAAALRLAALYAADGAAVGSAGTEGGGLA